MCGLTAMINQGSCKNSEAIVASMLSKIAHRGPDGDLVMQVDHGVTLGHCRLAIIDIYNGEQPISTPDGRFHLVFNGEIYNFRELKLELETKGYSFRTNSDSEVLLFALVEFSENVFDKLNGMFAFVFYDALKKSWIAARDHFGIKPLYYAEITGGVIFASEIKALLVHPELERRVNPKGLAQYFTMQFCLSDTTLFSGIKKVEPATYIIGKSVEIVGSYSYWKQSYEVDHSMTQASFEENLRWLLRDSMRLQMRSDVPLGAYLSGGIDSSLVASLASEHVQGMLPVFHGKFIEGPQYDESNYAKMVANSKNCAFYEVIPTQQDFVDYLSSLIYALDEPLAGPGVFPQFMTSKLAADHVKVVLGGQGGDEIFGGYARYLVAYLEQALKSTILGYNEEGADSISLESITPNIHLLKQYTPLMKHFWSQGLFSNMAERYFHLIDRSQGSDWMLHSNMKSLIDRSELFEDFRTIFESTGSSSYVNKMTYFDQKTLLPALLQVEDRMSMNVSIESRVPLLDRRIVDFVSSVPPQIKFQGGKTKQLLKGAIAGLIPAQVLHREDKMGFPVPISSWMKKGKVRDYVADTLLSKNCTERGIYNAKSVEKMLINQGVGGRQLWGALSLELWHREFIDAS